jgi:hypothetical protein
VVSSGANMGMVEENRQDATLLGRSPSSPGLRTRYRACRNREDAARVILVGPSHDPCAAWTDAHGEPAVVIDVGSWAFEKSTIAIAAQHGGGVRYRAEGVIAKEKPNA